MSVPDPNAVSQRAGVTVIPLRTPTLPPATHTNAVLVGKERFWIVDPATPHPEERARLLAHVDARIDGGAEPAGILLTHHHQDHVGAARWLHRERGWPILAHPLTQQALEGRVPVHSLLDEGDTLSGSEHADDQWSVLHTPGHAQGHIVLWEATQRWMIAGDMVAAVGTIIIEPSEGHMATYIAQLRRLAALDPVWLVPAHGAPIEQPVAHLEHYVTHRLAREARVVKALEAGSGVLAEVTRRSYPDVPASLHALAERSCLAHLIKLQEEERAREQSGVWEART